MGPHYLNGTYRALERLGLLKTAGEGNVQEQITSATGPSGRLLGQREENPQDSARTAFMEHDEQMNAPADASTVMPVGSNQNKVAAKASGYPLQGRTTFQGLKISIEQKKGAVRKWKDEATGEEGSTKMLYPYGYIRMTEGADGDHVDCYIGPKEDASHAYIVNQMTKGDWSKFDEQKVMLGFRNATEAKNAYLGQYDDPRFFGSMVVMPMDEFKKKVLDKQNWGRKIATSIPINAAVGSLIGSAASDKDHRLTGALKGGLLAGLATPVARELLRFRPKGDLPSLVTSAGLLGLPLVASLVGATKEANIQAPHRLVMPTAGALAGSGLGALSGAITSDPGKRLEGASRGALYGGLVGTLSLPLVDEGLAAIRLSPVLDEGTKELLRDAIVSSGVGAPVLMGSLPSRNKKASNLSEADRLFPLRPSVGSHEDEVPGEYLGVTGKLRNGNDSQPGGWEASPEDTIDHAFHFMDQEDGTRALDGAASAAPASPAV